MFNINTFFKSRESQIPSDRLKALVIKYNFNYLFKGKKKGFKF